MFGTLVNIIAYSIGSLFWGILIGAACLLLFFCLVKGWWKDAEFSPFTYVVGAVLGILLVFQSTLICGSVSIINKAEEFEELATYAVQQVCNSGVVDLNDIVDQQETQMVMDEIVKDHPILKHYCDYADFSGHSLRELPSAMTSVLKTYLKKYIVRRLLWSLAFVVVAAILVNYTITRSHIPSSHSRRPYQGAGRERMANSHRPNLRRRRYR